MKTFVIGRVAAGAIAEKYLRAAHGIEVIAFVSSVGKIHLPASVAPPSLLPSSHNEDDDDDAGDALSPAFVDLLKTINRETVDSHPTRCPHTETAERMTKVESFSNFLFVAIVVDGSANVIANHPSERGAGLDRRDRDLRHSKFAPRSRGAMFR